MIVLYVWFYLEIQSLQMLQLLVSRETLIFTCLNFAGVLALLLNRKYVQSGPK